MKLEFVTHSPEETEALAARLAEGLTGGEVLAMFGGMGMGKTAFVRGLAVGLQVAGEVSSPTFALVNEYQGRLPVAHFDMYRVESWDDLYSTGFFDYLDTDCVLAIEWSENIENALPDDSIRVEITAGEREQERKIVISGWKGEPICCS